MWRILEAATSISPETWRKASLWSERALLGLFALGVFVCVPWMRVAAGLQARRERRLALAPAIAEAERARLTFPEVVVSFPAHAGKTVYWEVTVQSSTSSFAEGRPAWPIVWTNPERVQQDEIRDGRVLARVAGVRDEVVYLDYLGKP